MAATRKLQGEIDRCLKKVAEGVETFEDIWKKVHNATNSNQKEKYEADLKKEIKKLQRLRDQIKSWIASAEIKDKTSLLDNRRLIETQMERFKIVERETKTKAYSKEGLGAAQKMDPAQRKKDDTRNWITNSISSLQLQIDQYESEVESLLAGKKKRLDRDKQDRMDELRAKLDRHKFHVSKLETLLRLLDNDSVEAHQVDDIKDNVEYYINSSQEPGFEEDEYIYDEIIGPDEVELSDSNNSNETSGSPSSITSGGSPVNSPPPIQQPPLSTSAQQIQPPIANNLNYSSDSTTLDSVSAEKRSKTDIASSKVKVCEQPVKPTAVRAAVAKTPSGSMISDASTNSKIISSTPSKNHNQPPPQQLQQPTAAAVVAAATTNVHTIPNNVSATAPTIAAALAATPSAGHNPTVQQHAPAPSLSTSGSAAGTIASAAMATAALVNSSAVTNSNIQGQSVIQATPTIAFAAVAKNNTSHPENGLVHPPATYAMASPTVASIVGASGQQQQQLSNLQTNSSNSLQNATLNNTSNTANSIANAVQQSTNTVNNIGNSTSNCSNNNSLANCISPNGMVAGLSLVLGSGAQQQQQQIGVVNNSRRNSPGLLSPKHMNGLQVSMVNNNNSVDAISLKTMAQEAINRSGMIESNTLTQGGPNVDTRQQQQVLQTHFSTDSTATTQHQQNNAVATAAAVAAASAAITNGPTTVNAGSVSSNLSNLSNNSTVQTVSNNPSLVNVNKQMQVATNEAHIPPLLGVAPLGPSPLHKDHQLQFQMMEAAYYHLPTASDSEKLTTYFHRTPVQTPPHYPQSQLPIYDTVEFYQRLSTETLFFVFYYMEGSKAQYLAAKALKKQSWRFHTKYMMWFQRHEEPKIINDDYEQGTYIYFDYEKWSQRKKEGFTFEYKYLEDKELN